MRPFISTTLVVLAMSVSGLTFADTKPADASAYATDSITVTGFVKTTLTLSVADLRAMPAQSLNDVVIRSLSGASKGDTRMYRGVLLRDVINRANIDAIGRSDLKKTLILAKASDDYVALFTWNELFNTAVGDAVLVVYEKDGVALTADEGHIALISGNDIRTGPRHVKWLKSIEVRKLNE